MAKIFSVASWNVEHFKDDPGRIDKVVAFLAKKKPDVFGLYEVEGKMVFDALVSKMPGYTFQITEGEQTQEILVGIRRNLTAFITQKTEFRSGTTHMRPGQLVTVNVAGRNYSILFLHVASGVDPRGMGLRDDMVTRALDFRKAIAAEDVSKGGDGDVAYMFLGDLNCMGMDYPFGHGIAPDLELRKWDEAAQKAKANKMRRLPKTLDKSWSNGSKSRLPDSNLDHVFATDNLKFRTFPRAGGGKAEVKVTGWAEFEGKPARKDAWIHEYSDHSMIWFELVT
jgi:endonuclease/exonuclease/phosphatase family metal-dependent hydrolase